MTSIYDFLRPALPFVYAGVTLLVTWVVAKAADLLFRRTLGRSMPQVAASGRRLAVIIIWVAGGVVAVQQLGVATEIVLLLIAIAGAAAVVAFRGALENVGAKYFSDVFIPYRIGDSVKLGEYSGTVLEINPMSTVLLSDQDQLVSVPNSRFVREVVVNTTPQAWKEVVIPISLDNEADLPLFESELRKGLTKLRTRLDPRFSPLLIRATESARYREVTLTLMVREPQDRDAVTSEANRRIALVLESIRRRGSRPSAAPG